MKTAISRRKTGAPGAWTVAMLVAVVFLVPLQAGAEGRGDFLADSFSDAGSSADADPLFEFLVLKLAADMGSPDFYLISGSVGTASGEMLARASQRLYLETGPQRVSLAFNGRELAALLPGTVLVFDTVLSDASGKVLDTATYRSQRSYSGAEFDASGSKNPEFSGAVREIPEDIDGDGLYEFLNISAGVKNITGPAEIAGILSERLPGAGHLIITDKEAGTGIAFVRFPGGEIRDMNISGNYTAVLILRADAGETLLRYLTRFYNASSFEAPAVPLTFTGRGTDDVIDKDLDGANEMLRVIVEVEVRAPGIYYFKAVMSSPLGQGPREPFPPLPPRMDSGPSAGYEMRFPLAGMYNITFEFDGVEISMFGIDGPYDILLTGVEQSTLLAANGRYHTSTYLAFSFEKPLLPVSFTGNVDETAVAVRKGTKERYAALVLNVEINVRVAGSYALTGVLMKGGEAGWGGYQVAVAGMRGDVAQGIRTVKLRFEGGDISASALDGPYTAVLFITPGEIPPANEPSPVRLVYVTKAYSAGDFIRKQASSEPPVPGADDPLIKVGEQSYQSRLGTISVDVNTTRPEVVFYYTADNGSSVRFRLTFNGLAAYSDVNGNGRLDTGEARYGVLLANAVWTAGKVEFISGAGGAKVVVYNLTSTVDLMQTGSGAKPGAGYQARVAGWAKINFRFTLSNADYLLGNGYGISLKGGRELKIDFIVEPLKTLPAEINALALEHFLTDENHAYTYSTQESGGVRYFRSGSLAENDTSFGKLAGPLQKIGLLTSKGREHGYYSWLSAVSVDEGSGPVEKAVNLTYSTDGTQMRLLLHYPFSQSVKVLVHDPTVGVNATNAPVTERGITVDKSQFNLPIYILTIFVAVTVVMAARRQK